MGQTMNVYPKTDYADARSPEAQINALEANLRYERAASARWQNRTEQAYATIAAVKALLATASDERGITWWEWIDGGLGGTLHDDLKQILEPDGKP